MGIGVVESSMWEDCVLVAQPFCLARICGSGYFYRHCFLVVNSCDLNWIFQFLVCQPRPGTILMRQNVTHDANRDEDDLIDFTCTGGHRRKKKEKEKEKHDGIMPCYSTTRPWE